MDAMTKVLMVICAVLGAILIYVHVTRDEIVHRPLGQTRVVSTIPDELVYELPETYTPSSNMYNDYAQTADQEPAPDCPAGTFQAGTSPEGPICRNEPTGCPYGDSIPMDVCEAKRGSDE